MADLFQAKLYINPYSLLVVTKSGRLMRIFCPFRVKVIEENSYFLNGSQHHVALVKMGKVSGLIYVIDNEEYSSSLFTIIL